MKKTVIGILADVDAGKTTLSEAMLYIGGVLRKKGRVDHGDAFLDTHSLEKARGITIFSKQAIFTFEDTVFTLLDTPGHADFTAEAERTLQVLDMAVLIVSASDGVAGHTETLWKMLAARNIPTLIFVNKTDMAGFDRQAVTEDMHRRLSRNIVDFTAEDDTLLENLAMCDEILLDLYTENGTLSDGDISAAAARRTVFPCCFGSALKSDGVERLLDLLNRLSPDSHRFGEFAAQVYKIERDSSGKRMTCMKITGGTLKVRNIIRYTDSGGTVHEEKVSRIRIYNGGKFEEVDSAETGDVCAVMGLSMTFSGQGLGEQADSPSLQSEPVMTYRVLPPDGCDNFTLMSKLTELQEEDPQLHITYDERHDEIYVRLMGEIQTEILRSLVNERFGLDVTVDSGRILYRETVAEAVEGVGHFEPLKHYAEVHVVISPLEQGSGIIFESVVSEDRLDRNWQNLILGSLQSKTHIGRT
jgi:small GTP-binding protein